MLSGRAAILREKTTRIRGSQAVGRKRQEKSKRLPRIKYLSEDHEILKVQEKKTISKKGLIILHRDG